MILPELVTFGLRIHNYADLAADPTVEHSFQVCNVAPRSKDSRRHESLLGERVCEIDIIPDYSALPALLSNDWTYVGQAQGENFGQQEGLYEALGQGGSYSFLDTIYVIKSITMTQ